MSPSPGLPGSAAALTAVPELVHLEAGRITTRLRVDADEPCFTGHYPGFPILPGVLLIDTVDRSVRRFAAEHGLGPVQLAEVRSTRFITPVFPGDEVTTDCTVKHTDDVLTVNARCATENGAAASIRLRFRLRDGRRPVEVA